MMKKYLIIFGFVFFSLVSLAQKFQIGIYGGPFWDKGLSAFMGQNNTYAYAITSNRYQAGLIASVNIGKNFSLHTGYDYSHRSLQVNLFANNPVNSYTGTDIHANSFPLLLGYHYKRPSWNGKSIILRAGGGLEIFTPIYSLFGRYATENAGVFTFKYGLFYTIKPPKNPIPFVQGYIGLGDDIGKNGNISIGLAYKFLLSDFTYEMYYYFSDFYNPPVEETFPKNYQISEISIQAIYSLGFKRKNP